MDFLHAILFSIVEGITEFLPISSTGHLILTAKLLNIPQTEFIKSFEIIIQLGAILAVVVLYWKTLLRKNIWRPVLIAFLPTAIIGATVYKVVKEMLLGNAFITVAALFIGGIILILIEYFYKEKKGDIQKIEDITTKKAVIIGLAQAVSMIPGTSRSAATVIGARLLNVSRTTAVEFSFLLAIPTMVAATGLDLVKSKFAFSPDEYAVLAVGFIGSFIVAILAVKFFVRYVQQHTFIAFGVYRIILAIVFYIFILR